MIPVDRQAEPETFCAGVRLKGLRALACQIGLDAPIVLRGAPPGAALPQARIDAIRALHPDELTAAIPKLVREIPSQRLAPHWTASIDDLRRLYGHTCAYLGMRLSRSTAMATVDHFIPKNVAPLLAYEWGNFRLSAHLVNSRKGQGAHLDPFDIEDGWFVLDDAGLGEVIPEPSLRETDPDLYAAIDHTIETLELNSTPFVQDRRTYLEWCEAPDLVAAVRELAPFVHREAVRHGWAVAPCATADDRARETPPSS